MNWVPRFSPPQPLGFDLMKTLMYRYNSLTPISFAHKIQESVEIPGLIGSGDQFIYIYIYFEVISPLTIQLSNTKTASMIDFPQGISN